MGNEYLPISQMLSEMYVYVCLRDRVRERRGSECVRERSKSVRACEKER